MAATHLQIIGFLAAAIAVAVVWSELVNAYEGWKRRAKDRQKDRDREPNGCLMIIANILLCVAIPLAIYHGILELDESHTWSPVLGCAFLAFCMYGLGLGNRRSR